MFQYNEVLVSADGTEAPHGIVVHLLALFAPHVGDPAPLLLALGLTMPTRAIVKGEFVKTMAAARTIHHDRQRI